MKYALVDGVKAEASPKAKGFCPSCASPLIARCGQVKVWHWAHKGNPPCDPWWENETAWHRTWKGHFPIEWQEVIHQAESGEKHIADVKTDQGWVLEFQHSYLKPEERQARDSFYEKLIWIVDGTRRKRDKTQFFRALEDGSWFDQKIGLRSVFIDECALVREWAGCRAPVFFDFSEETEGKDTWLWCLLPGSTDMYAYIGRYPRNVFIDLHCNEAGKKWQDFVEFYQGFRQLIAERSRHKAQGANIPALQPQRGRSRQSQGFQQYISRKQRSRRCF
jgi:hypothetical protein